MKNFLIFLLVFISITLIPGCSKKLNISDNVTFVYTGYYSDWVVFETATKDIIIWSGEIPKFMEDVLMENNKSNKTIELTVVPEDAYWPLYNNSKLQKIPKFVFDKIFSWFTIGDTKKFSDIQWLIKWIEVINGDDYVLFDINPRQTWDDLKYEIRVLDNK